MIAIENVRLFDEVQARTRELARSVDELRALGEVSHAVNSTLDLETVLSTIVAKAVQLSATDAGAIYVFSKLRQKFRLRATYGMSEGDDCRDRKAERWARRILHRQGHRKRRGGSSSRPHDRARLADTRSCLGAGYRALLVVPLLRPGRVVGALVVRRKEPGLFPSSTIDLLQTFAAQSVLAIQNARLFEDVEARTRELAKSLEELRAAQERLIQTEKLASLGQLTAGIAHEIKNPLNFVNNFAALSIELIDELKDAIGSAPQDEEQTAELMELLAGNLEQGGAARQARRFDRQEHAAALARGIGRAQGCRHQCARRGESESRLSRRASREAGLQRHDRAVVRSVRRRGRCAPPGDHPGVPQSDLEWLLRDGEAEGASDGSL